MKRLIIIISILMPVFLCSCDDDNNRPDGMLMPYQLSLSIQNADGENLLDPAIPGNILDEPITISWREHSDQVALHTSDLWNSIVRDEDARWLTPELVSPMESYNNYIQIGLFRHKDCDETITIKFGEQTHELRFVMRENKKNWQVDEYLDGELVNVKPTIVVK